MHLKRATRRLHSISVRLGRGGRLRRLYVCLRAGAIGVRGGSGVRGALRAVLRDAVHWLARFWALLGVGSEGAC